MMPRSVSLIVCSELIVVLNATDCVRNRPSALRSSVSSAMPASIASFGERISSFLPLR